MQLSVYREERNIVAQLMAMLSEVPGRLFRELLERAIKLRQRVETAVQRDMTDWVIRFKQGFAYLLYALAGDVFGEAQSRLLLECPAEMLCAQTHQLRHITAPNFFCVVFLDMALRLSNCC
jgi:hypothetical protein